MSIAGMTWSALCFFITNANISRVLPRGSFWGHEPTCFFVFFLMVVYAEYYSSNKIKILITEICLEKYLKYSKYPVIINWNKLVESKVIFFFNNHFLIEV